MEFISEEHITDIIEEMDDISTKLDTCRGRLVDKQELDDVQLVFLESIGITV